MSQRTNRNRKTAGVRFYSVEQREGLTGLIRFRVSRFYASSYIVKEYFAHETSQFLVRPNGSKVAKEGQEYVYFLSWESARDHALSIAERELAVAQATLERIKVLAPGELLGGTGV